MIPRRALNLIYPARSQIDYSFVSSVMWVKHLIKAVMRPKFCHILKTHETHNFFPCYDYFILVLKKYIYIIFLKKIYSRAVSF